MSGLIKSPLLDKYEQIVLNSDTRYYYNDNQYITYRMYLNNKDKCKKFRKDEKFLRMFSCCEKKMISKLFRDSYKDKYRIYVKYEPCPMCKKAIKAYDKEICGIGQAYICYPKNAWKPELKGLDEYNEMARELKRMSQTGV